MSLQEAAQGYASPSHTTEPPPLRRAFDAVDAQAALRKAEQVVDVGMKEPANGIHKTISDRNSAMSDGLTIIARARARAGGDASVWTPHHAALAFNVIGLILEAQGAALVDVEAAFIDPEGLHDHTKHDAWIEAVIKSRRAPAGRT